MKANRLEAFSDGVLAILVTIMVLELRLPDDPGWHVLLEMRAEFLTYALSFAFLGIYWNNHHHMLHMAPRVNGAILWANLLLLFWLSLVPALTGWMGRHPADTAPAAAYGIVLLLAAISYYLLQQLIIREQGPGSTLAAAVGRDVKGRISPIIYLAAIGAAFVSPVISYLLYVIVALIWIVPDPRIEKHVRRA